MARWYNCSFARTQKQRAGKEGRREGRKRMPPSPSYIVFRGGRRVLQTLSRSQGGEEGALNIGGHDRSRVFGPQLLPCPLLFLLHGLCTNWPPASSSIAAVGWAVHKRCAYPNLRLRGSDPGREKRRRAAPAWDFTLPVFFARARLAG